MHVYISITFIPVIARTPLDADDIVANRKKSDFPPKEIFAPKKRAIINEKKKCGKVQFTLSQQCGSKTHRKTKRSILKMLD